MISIETSGNNRWENQLYYMFSNLISRGGGEGGRWFLLPRLFIIKQRLSAKYGLSLGTVTWSSRASGGNTEQSADCTHTSLLTSLHRTDIVNTTTTTLTGSLVRVRGGGVREGGREGGGASPVLAGAECPGCTAVLSPGLQSSPISQSAGEIIRR